MLIILRSISGAGKTTLAERFIERNGLDSSVIVSTDNIRKSLNGNSIDQRNSGRVFEIANEIIETRMKNRMFTIFDATNLRMKSFRKAIENAEFYGNEYRILGIVPNFERSSSRIKERVLSGGLYISDEILKKQIDAYTNTNTNIIRKIGENYIECEFTADVQLHIKRLYKNHLGNDTHVLQDGEELWTIGDVHGCPNEFLELIDKINAVCRKNGTTPVIYQVGDIVDRGPDFKKVFKVLMENNINFIVGNHEINLLSEFYEKQKNTNKERKVTIDELSTNKLKFVNKFMGFIRKSPHYKYIVRDGYPEKYLLTHGGVSWDITHDETMTHSMMACLYGHRGNIGINNDPYMIQIHGHKSWEYYDINEQIKDGKLNNKDMYNIDGGLVYGGELVAFNPEFKTCMTVKSHKIYHKK